MQYKFTKFKGAIRSPEGHNHKIITPYRLLGTYKFNVRMTLITKLMRKIIDVCHSGFISLDVLHKVFKFLL